jgi:hypothetical protein
MNHHTIYVGRRKAVPCIVNGIRHVKISSKRLWKNRAPPPSACTPVGEPGRVLAGLPPVTP